MVAFYLMQSGREAIPMTSMRRDDVIWTMVITLIAVTINPILKSIGLLPADVFRSLGIFYPGLPQIVFGPLMAFFRRISSIAAPCWRRSSRAELRLCS